VNRLAHQRPLDDAPSLERTREIVPPKPVETGPEPDVCIRRVLVLDAANALERSRKRQSRPFEQELTREQRSIQVSLRENALRDPSTLAERPCLVCAA